MPYTPADVGPRMVDGVEVPYSPAEQADIAAKWNTAEAQEIADAAKKQNDKDELDTLITGLLALDQAFDPEFARILTIMQPLFDPARVTQKYLDAISLYQTYILNTTPIEAL